jgi:hypothetical protein
MIGTAFLSLDPAEDRVRALHEQLESQAASAFEELIAKPSFGRLLAMAAENAATVARITSDAADLVLRNLRIAGRGDITRLARQLHRAEDKLESVLQEVESLREQLATTHKPPRDGRGGAPPRDGRRSAVKRR